MSANDKQIGGDHYKTTIEHWDMIEDNGIGYLEAAATKYVTRWSKKDGLKDLGKAHHYTEKLLEKHLAGIRNARGEVPAEEIAFFAVANELGDVETEIVYLLTKHWTAADLTAAMVLIDKLIASAPKEDPVITMANKVIDACNNQDLSTSLTVLTNVVGQVLVSLGNGVPSEVTVQADMFAHAVKVAANNKLLFDAEAKGEG